mmetsp:Transcript_20619/g.48089  ORF Transcript_20619/g.48089 Transcript_20619/m.48089 type:complete len:272 (+) Transcript_20619:2552-3367(+)
MVARVAAGEVTSEPCSTVPGTVWLAAVVAATAVAEVGAAAAIAPSQTEFHQCCCLRVHNHCIPQTGRNHTRHNRHSHCSHRRQLHHSHSHHSHHSQCIQHSHSHHSRSNLRIRSNRRIQNSHTHCSHRSIPNFLHDNLHSHHSCNRRNRPRSSRIRRFPASPLTAWPTLVPALARSPNRPRWVPALHKHLHRRSRQRPIGTGSPVPEPSSPVDPEHQPQHLHPLTLPSRSNHLVLPGNSGAGEGSETLKLRQRLKLEHSGLHNIFSPRAVW